MARRGVTDRTVGAFILASKRATAQRTPKLFDGHGLYLLITPSGSAAWRLKYRLGGKENTYAIGFYPEIGIAAARVERDHVRAVLATGQDPIKARRDARKEAIKAASVEAATTVSFQSVAEDWLALRSLKWAPSHATRSRQALERDVFPSIGRLPVADINPGQVSGLIKAIIDRGCGGTTGSTASKVQRELSAIFEYARAFGLWPENRTNPAAPARTVVMQVADDESVRHHPALHDFDALRDVLNRVELAAISPSVRRAHRLVAFTVVRASNAVSAHSSQFDLDADIATWTIPRPTMKKRKGRPDYRVILGPTIAAELREWIRLIGGSGYLFPSPTGKRPHIGVEALDKLYSRTLGLRDIHSIHGWRGSLMTLANESSERFDPVAVDLAVDHVGKSKVLRAYDHGDRVSERVRLAAWWDAQLSCQSSTDLTAEGRRRVLRLVESTALPKTGS
jgi:integrase